MLDKLNWGGFESKIEKDTIIYEIMSTSTSTIKSIYKINLINISKISIFTKNSAIKLKSKRNVTKSIVWQQPN